MFDNDLFLRTTGAGSLTATETSAGVAIKGTPLKGLAAVVNIPKKSVGDTVLAKVQHSTDNVTYTDLVSFETVASVTAASTTPIQLVRRFATELKYVRVELTVAGTSPDFGAVSVVIGNADQWNRLPVAEITDPTAGTVI